MVSDTNEDGPSPDTELSKELSGLNLHRNLSTTMGHSTGLIREQCPVW